MRTLIVSLAVILLNFALTTSAFAQVCARPKGTYETFGDIVVDKTNKLAWKRCSDGQTWNGIGCSGQAEGYTFQQALTVTEPSDSGFVWRIPRPEELATLVITDASCTPAIDQATFPRTLPATYWTSQPLNKAADIALCQSFGAGAIASAREQCRAESHQAVRLVSAVPLHNYLPPAPAPASFNVDDTGTYLQVTGSNFSRTLADSLVNFPTASGVKAVVPTSGTGVSLIAEIPEDATTGAITVTTRGVTGQPARGTLRVINNKEGCVAAGFTPATIPELSWDYCILAGGFKDDPADALVVGAHRSKLPDTQPYYMLSTSHLLKAASASFTLSGRIVLQYGPSGLYGALVVHSNAGRDADTVTITGALANNGAVHNRGNFNNAGAFLNTGNGVIFNSGVFTNHPSPEKGLTIGSTGRAINVVSFSNSSGPSWPRAQLINLGTLATTSASTGIENGRGDIINSGTLRLEGARVFVNRSGASPGTVTNNGSIYLRIGTQPEGVPIFANEPGATIINNASGTITNAKAVWTFINSGIVRNCGTITGPPPGPFSYVSCETRTGPDGRIIK